MILLVTPSFVSPLTKQKPPNEANEANNFSNYDDPNYFKTWVTSKLERKNSVKPANPATLLLKMHLTEMVLI
eukprot:m.344919 g.344919  ORF g.344919 m.344919 type:complete len:72 (+) comp25420_c0_seq1:271-486(+)